MKITKTIISAVLAIIMMFSVSAFTPVTVSAAVTESNAETVYQVQITGSTVNLRKGAGTRYGKVATVKKGAKYTYLATKTVSGVKWYQIQYNSTTKAWVSGQYSKIVTATVTSSSVKKVQITGSAVNLRKGAGTRYGKVATVKKGAKYTYLATKTVSGVKWYQIQYNSTTKAWVSGKYSKIVTESAASSAAKSSSWEKRIKVTAETADIHVDWDSESDVLYTAKKGETIQYLYWTKTNSEGTWYCVRYQKTGFEGWIHEDDADLVSAAAETKTVNVVGALAEARVKFPDGKYWNSVGLSKKNTNGYTSLPCPSGHKSATCNGQCAGYVNKIGENIYGTAASKWKVVAKNTTWNKVKDTICVGDVIRYNNKHSVMVTAIDSDGIYVTDCNWNYHCRISWDRLFDTDKYISTVNYIYRHADNKFRSGNSTLYLDGKFSDATGKVRICNSSRKYSGDADSEKYDYDIDYYYYNTYRNTVRAYQYPDENSKVVALPLDGEIYYCYAEVMNDKQVYYLVRFNSTYGWIPGGSASFTRDIKVSGEPCGSWATDEVMTGVFNKLIAHANSSRLEVCDETVSFEKTDTAVIDASCFSSEKEFTDSLMKTFDKYAAEASGYDKCCFLMQCSGGTQYVISLYFG